MSKPIEDFQPLIAETAARYHYHSLPNVFSSFQEWVNDLLRWLAQQLQLSYQAGQVDTRMIANAFKIGLYAVGAICLCAGIYALLIKVRYWQGKGATRAATNVTTLSITTARDWQQESLNLASKGLFREACRSVYMACLRLLDEESILAFNSARSNYEYYYALQKNKTIQQSFRQMANLVDRFWFGNSLADVEDFASCQRLLEEIAQQVPGRTGDNALPRFTKE